MINESIPWNTMRRRKPTPAKPLTNNEAAKESLRQARAFTCDPHPPAGPAPDQGPAPGENLAPGYHRVKVRPYQGAPGVWYDYPVLCALVRVNCGFWWLASYGGRPLLDERKTPPKDAQECVGATDGNWWSYPAPTWARVVHRQKADDVAIAGARMVADERRGVAVLHKPLPALAPPFPAPPM